MNYLMAALGALSQGLVWAILAMGVFITFKLLNFADMSCEGSFALGGSISALLVVKAGLNPFITILIALLAGMMAGLMTGFLHTKLKIPAILSGILTMISLYSINLRIMGQANTSLVGQKTIISILKSILPKTLEANLSSSLIQTFITIGVGLVYSLIVVGVLYWFFGTEIGSAIRATGNNENMVRAQGISTDLMKILGLMLSNGLIAVSGALVTQSQGYADVGMGIGAIVYALAPIVIGEVIFFKVRNFAGRLFGIIIGSIIYRIIIALVLQIGFNTNDLKLLSAVIVALALSIPVIRQNVVLAQRGNGKQ